MAKLLRALFIVGLLVVPIRVWSDSSVGVLVLSPDPTPKWRNQVTEAVKGAKLPNPTRVFVGVCSSPKEVAQLQKDVTALEKAGAQKIIVVPLTVSRFADVYRQWRYLLGADVKPGFIETPYFPIRRKARIEFTQPLDDDPELAEMVLERAEEISQDPSKEQVFIVAPGIHDDEYNWEWTKTIDRLAARVAERGKFRQIHAVTLRDEPPSSESIYPIRPSLREQVEAVSQKNERALVIPLLLTPTGLENRIRIELKRVEYTANPRLLLPDYRFAMWIRAKVGL